jgi:hypothetical protein
MRKKERFINRYFEKYFFIAVFGFIELFSFFRLVIPFLRDNNLYVWDMIGHYFSAWYVKNFLFPAVSGWNPFFFLGYPQNYFYPPLYSYLSALLGKVIGLELSFKLILVIVILVMPFSFYYFARKFGFDRVQSVVIMLAMYGILFMVPSDQHLGGNMHATFNVGLVNHALALVIFFFYVGKLKEGFEKGNFVGASILMALIVLSHIITAVVAGLVFLGFLIANVKNKKGIMFGIKHVALSFGLSAFWVVPFFWNIGYTRSIQIGHGFAGLMGVLFLICFGYLIYAYKKRNEYLPIALFLILFLGFMYFGDRYLHLPIHFYRFQIFFYLFVPFLIVSVLRKDKIVLFLLVGVSLFSVLNVQDLHPEGVLNLPLMYNISRYEDGRLFVIASPGNQPSPHIYQHLIPMRSGNYGVKGLFVESSPNSRYVFDLEKGLDKYSLVWGSRLDNTGDLNYSIIKKELELFNINYVFSFYKADDSWRKIKRVTFFNNYVNGEIRRYFYELYKVGNSSLIEVLDYKPEVLKGDWDDRVSRWFISDNVSRVYVDSEVPDYKGKGNESVEILEVSERQDYLRFRVDSDKRVPVLVKISYFPNWKAYEDGKEIKVYRASPHLMLVYGKGLIEMRFERSFLEVVSSLISGLCGLGVLGLFIKRFGKCLK